MSSPFIFIGYDNHTTCVLHPTDHERNIKTIRERWENHCSVYSRGYSPDCCINGREDVEKVVREYTAWAEHARSNVEILAETLGVRDE